MERALSTESKLKEKLPLNRWKISDSKLLRVGHRKVRERNDDIQILYVVEDDLDDAWKVFNNFSFEHFKNVFVIILEIFDFKSEHVEKFLKFLSLEIKMDRDVYLQFYMRDMKFYVNPKASNAFEEIKPNEGREAIVKQLSFNGNRLRRESFFGILKALYLPIVDVSYGQILDFLSQSGEVDIFLLLKNAIKAEDEVMVRILMLFVPQSEQELLDDSLKFKNPRILLSVLRNFSLNDLTEEQIQEILENKKRNEILLTIARQNDLRMLKLLTNNPKVFKNFFDFKIWHEARKIAFNKNFQEFLYELQVIETEYYDEFDKDIENDIAIFHANIERKLFTEIKEAVVKFPAFKLLLNKDGLGALEKAIDCKAFKIYAYLLSQNFVTVDKQSLNAKIESLHQHEKHEIRDQNLKFLSKSADHYVNILASKFDYFSGPTNSNATETRRMLEKLKKFEDIREVMKNSIFSDIKIVSDFNTENISVMNPTRDESTHGIIYIGSSINKNHRYATFAHELTQFVLFTVYENKCLPYCKGDEKREAEWDEIVKKTRESYENDPEGTDNIIKYVFEYYESRALQSLQLAVRVNEILAFYFDDPEKVRELEARHADLFDYHRNRVLSDLRIPHIVRMIKLNKCFGVLDKIVKSPLHVVLFDCNTLLDKFNGNDRKFLVSNVPQLTFSKILNELKNSEGNKLYLKAKNLFVDPKMLDNDFLKAELKSLLRSGFVEKIIVDGNDAEKLETLDPRVSTIIVINDTTKNELESSLNPTLEFIALNHEWEELREKTQQIILNKAVKFQGMKMKLSEILANFDLSPEILKIVCTDVDVILINPVQVEEIEFLMPFRVKKGNERNFSLEDFLFDEIKSEKVVLISDIAGHGKSTMLSKMFELLSKESPSDWISIVCPKNYNTSRTDLNCENFTEFATQILLDLNALEAAIFTQKFNEGKVKILLDDFHEVPKEFNEKFKGILGDFSSSLDSNQIFITSRKAYEQDLKADKCVYEIEKFDKKAQTDFFSAFWKHNNPGLDAELIESCSFLMYERIDVMMRSSTKTIGLPLIIQSFANAFKDKINEAFSNMTEHLYISDVFEKIFTSNFKILRLNFNENPHNYIIKSDSILRVCQYFAVVYLLGEEFASELGLSYDDEEWPRNEIKQCEIIKFNKAGSVEFKNKIFPEFLIAKLMIKILRDNKKASEAQLRLFMKILNGEKFQIACFFIDEMLDDFEEKNFKFFEPSDKFCEKIIKSEKYRDSILKFSSQEGLCNIFAFVLHLMQKTRDTRLYERASKELTTKSRQNFTKILSSAQNRRAFGKLLNKLSSNKVMIECLTKVKGNKRQETLLSVTISHGWESNVLFLFRRIAESFENDELKSILKTRGADGENILCSACKNPNLASIECVWEYIENYFKPREIAKLILKRDKNGDNVLHYAAKYAQSDENMSVIFAKINDFIKEPEALRKFLLAKGSRDMNALLQSLNNDDTLLFMFESIYCAHLELKSFIYESDASGENFLLKLDQFGGEKILQESYDDLQYAQLRETLRILIQLKKQREESPKVVVKKRELSIAFLMKHSANQLSSEELEKVLTMNKFHCDQNLIIKFTNNKTMRSEVTGKPLEEYPGDCPFLKFHYNATS